MKTSHRKLEANRRNALKSCGPKSPEGKAASSRNAFRHGLSTGELTVLRTENQADLDQLIIDLDTEFKPVTKTEQFFVDEMVQARWKARRARRLEAEAFDRIMEAGAAADADRRILAAMEAPGNILEKLGRYAAGAERAFSKAVRDLAQLRANAARAEKQNKAKDDQLWLQTALAKAKSRPTIDPFAYPDPITPLAFDSNELLDTRYGGDLVNMAAR